MKSKRSGEKLIYWAMRGITYLVVLFIAYIIIKIFINGLPAISWEFLTADPQKSGAEGGIFPAIIGTLYLIIGTIVIALPLGMFSAIYLAEYSKNSKFTQSIRMAIVTLAGVPSIVFGLFGLGLFVITLDFGSSILAGSITLACMILPTIIVASEEALKSVPQYMREGSLALGATKWETIYKNVLPYALPGMLTGSILGVGRAAGETAPILLTAAAFY
jgi:phosphate transport system permease protein